MDQIRVGGVPEHFNYPWHLGIERGYFTKQGVFVNWTDYKMGTGAMITALLNDEVDVIVALTEGLASEIINKGSPIQIFGTYVKSPLHWSVITGKDSPYTCLEDLKKQTIAISRFTSGSHIMTCVMAGERGWHPQNDVDFKVVGSFQDLRNSVNSQETAAFLWEHFTTQPFVDSGEVRFIGDITTPWSCFMLAGKKDFLLNHADLVRRTLKGLREASEFFHHTSELITNISENYGLTLENAREWYKTVNITASSGIAESSLVRVVDALFQSKVTTRKDFPITSLIAPHLAEIETDIKHMKLYSKPELLKYLRNSLIANEKATGPLNYTELLPFDQHHYFGVEAIDNNIKSMGITKDSKVINIGASLGGPARYLSGKYGCQVLAIELQDDLHRTGKELTERCGLKNVTHMAGDFLEVGQYLKENFYDSIVSWLTILHIQNREKLFESAFHLLKPGGILYAEDFYKLHLFTPQEIQTLQYEVSCPYVPDLNTYKNQLRKAGFEVVSAEDLTESWKEFTANRVAKFEGEKDSILKVHRHDTFNRLLFFYTQIRDLFAGGNLGGARFIARKPL